MLIQTWAFYGARDVHPDLDLKGKLAEQKTKATAANVPALPLWLATGLTNGWTLLSSTLA